MSQHFLHYTITNTLEHRATHTIYLAIHDDRPERTVVLKIFHKPTFVQASTQKIFLQEADKLSHLDHPYVAPILEAGIEEKQAYIVSTYMPNGSLRVHLDRTYPQQLPFQQAMTIISQIGQGLIYLHSRYLIHGQITPESILFDANGRAYLSDFACAIKQIGDQEINDNARYLAPEQLAGVQNELSDQYAFCCVAYEVFTGRPPFLAQDPKVLADQPRDVAPIPPRQLVPQLSFTIERALLQGLAKDPTQRHADIASLLTALQQAQITINGSDLPLPRSKRKTASFAPPVHIPRRTKYLSDQMLPLASASIEPVTASEAEVQLPESALAEELQQDSNEQPIAPEPVQVEEPSINLVTSNVLDEVPVQPIASQSQAEPTADLDDDWQETALDEILRTMELQVDESMLNEPTAPTTMMEIPEHQPMVNQPSTSAEVIKKRDQDPQVAFATLMASLSEPGTQPAQPLPNKSSAPQAVKGQNTLSTRLQRPAQSSLKPSSSSVVTGSRWPRGAKRRTTIMAWSLLFLLMLGSLWTYNALAAKLPASSTLTLLTNLPNPTQQATIDSLGILAPATTPPALTQPALKTPSKSATQSTVTPTSKAVLPITVPTPTPHTIATTPPKPTATPQPANPIGKTIWLKSTANGKYVQDSDCSSNGPMSADATQVSTAEELTVVANSDGTIDFQAVTTGKYVSAKESITNTPLLSCITRLSGWEKFIWVDLGGGNVALKARNGNYVTATLSATNAPLYATSTSTNANTLFTWGSIN